MTNCIQESFSFPSCCARTVEAEFTGGDVTSDGHITLSDALALNSNHIT